MIMALASILAVWIPTGYAVAMCQRLWHTCRQSDNNSRRRPQSDNSISDDMRFYCSLLSGNSDSSHTSHTEGPPNSIHKN